MAEFLMLRDSYVFREKIPPWEKEEITDPGTPKRNPNPFLFKPEPKSSVGVSVFLIMHCLLFRILIVLYNALIPSRN